MVDKITDSELLYDKKCYLPDKIGVFYTDNNVPYQGGLVIAIPQDKVNFYNTQVKNNSDYWKEHNIVQVSIMRREDYYNMLRKGYRDYIAKGLLPDHIDNVIRNKQLKEMGLVDSSGNPLKVN